MEECDIDMGEDNLCKCKCVIVIVIAFGSIPLVSYILCTHVVFFT